MKKKFILGNNYLNNGKCAFVSEKVFFKRTLSVYNLLRKPFSISMYFNGKVSLIQCTCFANSMWTYLFNLSIQYLDQYGHTKETGHDSFGTVWRYLQIFCQLLLACRIKWIHNVNTQVYNVHLLLKTYSHCPGSGPGKNKTVYRVDPGHSCPKENCILIFPLLSRSAPGLETGCL